MILHLKTSAGMIGEIAELGGVVVFGEELSDHVGSLLGSRWGRFASFDNGREV